MNEFEWRRQLRDLQQPVVPRDDLWSRIDAAIDAPEAAGSVSRRSGAARRQAFHAPVWLLVASFIGITLLAVGLGLQQSRQPIQPPVVASAPAHPGLWKPEDPRLAGAAVELNAARMELRQAIQQSPDSNGLQRLLLRTEQQQSRLRHLDQAG
jgi:hypothetical protein